MSATAVKHHRHEPVEFDTHHDVAHHEVAARARYVEARRHLPPSSVETAHDETEQLLRRILEDGPVPATSEEVVVEASRARRRARSRHRPFRLSKTQWCIAITLMGQLTGVLWWQSQALSLRNRDQRLKDEIGKMGQQIAQTKNAISQLDSEGNLSALAAQMQWSRAPVSNFDDVSKNQRLTPQESAALAAAASADGSEAATAPEPADAPASATPTTDSSANDLASGSTTMPNDVISTPVDVAHTPATPGVAPLPDAPLTNVSVTEHTATRDGRTDEGH